MSLLMLIGSALFIGVSSKLSPEMRASMLAEVKTELESAVDAESRQAILFHQLKKQFA